jgi:hypothetical protein
MSKPVHAQNFKEYNRYYNFFRELSIKIDFLNKFYYYFNMEIQHNVSCQAGKGDRPRNCFSNKYRKNYDMIDWNKKNEKNKINIDVAPPPKRRLSTP